VCVRGEGVKVGESIECLMTGLHTRMSYLVKCPMTSACMSINGAPELNGQASLRLLIKIIALPE
jgi:hypothetical protein